MGTTQGGKICPAASQEAVGIEGFGNLERVIVTLGLYPRLFEFHQFDNQNTIQVSQWCGVRAWVSVCMCV